MPFSPRRHLLSFFFFNDTATTEIYTLSLHDALPISARDFASRGPDWGSPSRASWCGRWAASCGSTRRPVRAPASSSRSTRSEEHTSELQSPCNLVCRLLLEKKKDEFGGHHSFHYSEE